MTKWLKPRDVLKSAVWIPVLVAALALALGLMISSLQSERGWWPFLGALLITVLIFFIALHIILAKVCPMSLDLMHDLKAQIDRYISRDTITWLIDNEQMAQFEENSDLEEIWLITSDLSEDIPGAVFFDVVHQNLKRGVRYRYFIPRSLEAEARAKQLIENHGSVGNITIVPLSDDFFWLVPRLDFAIYDPMNKSGHRCGYMGLHIDTDLRLHCDMEAQFVDLLIGKLHSLSKRVTIA